MTALAPQASVGGLVRLWRTRRRLSQQELSERVAVSARHLSCVENGRARPSAQMLVRLTEHLQVPLREGNELLLAGGYAPVWTHADLDAPALRQVSDALRRVLDAHLPFPALVLDRWWDVVDSNDAVAPLLDGVAAHLLAPPINVLRLSLHPDGLAPRIENLPQWRAHLLGQLDRRLDATGDARLGALRTELAGIDASRAGVRADRQAVVLPHEVVLPMRLRVGDTVLSLFSLAAQVATAGDVTVSELVLESFYPADDVTAAALRATAVTATAPG